MFALTLRSLLKNCSAASAAVLGLLGLCAVPVHAQTFTPAQTLTIDTSAISSTRGYYEFQFNPTAGIGAVTNPLATKISSISYGGVSAPNIIMTNAGVGGDAFVPMTQSFGSSFSFNYAFSPGTLPGSDTGDDLIVFFYNADESQVLTTDPSGNNVVADIYVYPGGAPGDPLQSEIYQQFDVLAPPAVPEASTTVSLGLLLTLGGLTLAVKKKRTAEKGSTHEAEKPQAKRH